MENFSEKNVLALKRCEWCILKRMLLAVAVRKTDTEQYLRLKGWARWQFSKFHEEVDRSRLTLTQIQLPAYSPQDAP